MLTDNDAVQHTIDRVVNVLSLSLFILENLVPHAPQINLILQNHPQ